MAEWITVAKVVDVPPDKALRVRHGPDRIALFNVGGRLFAISDACPHQGAPLSLGLVEGTSVTCALHGYSFELEAQDPPQEDGVYRYRVRIEGEDIQIEIPPSEGQA